MSEWRRYLKWRILTLAAGLGIMEVCSSNEMGAPNASHLGTGDTQPNNRSRPRSVPVNAFVVFGTPQAFNAIILQ
jgi:hypothetical protein